MGRVTPLRPTPPSLPRGTRLGARPAVALLEQAWRRRCAAAERLPRGVQPLRNGRAARPGQPPDGRFLFGHSPSPRPSEACGPVSCAREQTCGDRLCGRRAWGRPRILRRKSGDTNELAKKTRSLNGRSEGDWERVARSRPLDPGPWSPISDLQPPAAVTLRSRLPSPRSTGAETPKRPRPSLLWASGAPEGLAERKTARERH